MFSFRIWFDSFFFRHQSETEIKWTDLLCLLVIASLTWSFLLELPKFSYSERFSVGCREKPLTLPKGSGCADGSSKGFEGFPGGRPEAPEGPFAHGLVEFLSLFCILHLCH